MDRAGAAGFRHRRAPQPSPGCRHNRCPVKPLSNQSARAALLVSPAAFGFNAETAASNRLQGRLALSSQLAQQRAADECRTLAQGLRAAGVAVCLAADEPEPYTPDAVFPNNWVSWHADGTVVLYPMLAPNRRAERRAAVLQQVHAELGFVERQRIDLSTHEADGRFLEGTGSLVLDRVNRIAYACRSARTDETVLREWAALLGYDTEVFDAAGPDGTPVYHTNVLLWIGARIAGVGAEWIAAADRERVLARLAAGGREVLQFPTDALLAFAGNMLELQGRDGPLLVMSERAAQALGAAAFARIAAAGLRVLRVAVPTIETLGGGSVRCMIAEVPLPPGLAA
jgi:hypothetical protein